MGWRLEVEGGVLGWRGEMREGVVPITASVYGGSCQPILTKA